MANFENLHKKCETKPQSLDSDLCFLQVWGGVLESQLHHF